MCFNIDEDILNAVSVDGRIISYNIPKKESFVNFVVKEAPIAIAQKKDNENLIVLFENLLISSKLGNIEKELKLKTTSQSMGYNHKTNEIYIGNTLVRLFILLLIIY